MNYWFVWPLNHGQFRAEDKWLDMKVIYLEDRLDFGITGINYFTSLDSKKNTPDDEGVEHLFVGILGVFIFV